MINNIFAILKSLIYRKYYTYILKSKLKTLTINVLDNAYKKFPDIPKDIVAIKVGEAIEHVFNEMDGEGSWTVNVIIEGKSNEILKPIVTETGFKCPVCKHGCLDYVDAKECCQKDIIPKDLIGRYIGCSTETDS